MAATSPAIRAWVGPVRCPIRYTAATALSDDNTSTNLATTRYPCRPADQRLRYSKDAAEEKGKNRRSDPGTPLPGHHAVSESKSVALLEKLKVFVRMS